jgi:hypothetical protein
MRVTTLPAWHIQDTRSDGESKQVNETRYFLSVALGREEKAVLQEIVGVECGLPPLARFLQKKTGSR